MSSSDKRIFDEGHDAFGDLCCKVGIDTWEEAEAIFRAVEKTSHNEIGTIETDAPYTNLGGWHFYPDGVNRVRLDYDNWLYHEASVDGETNWNGAFTLFNPKRAIMYFDVVIEDMNLEEDERVLADGEAELDDLVSLKMWREILANFDGDITKAALHCEQLAVQFAARFIKSALKGAKEE